MTNELFEKIESEQPLTAPDLKRILELESPADLDRLFKAAYAVKERVTGRKVFLRGIIEISNICTKDCYYCGIRKSSRTMERFQLSLAEIVDAAMWANSHRYGSIVMQSGERGDELFIKLIEDAVREIKEKSAGQLGITLSMGEQTPEVYRRWFDAGAHRYLLRIESSNPELYRKLHPADHSHAARLQCLETLRSIGYQVGTGVMIGLPFQTLDDLVGDLLFFQKMDVDMIGMGPYLVSKDTPLAKEMPDFEAMKEQQLKLGLKMIAAARLLLKNVNIAATTALQALDPRGREQGLLAGANVIMPNLTAVQYRSSYQLYDNKPCLDENSEQCRFCLERRVQSIGESIGWDEWGDSRHFADRKK
ncbi:MAG: [FeFe] hydrogenase H-cluster radical SAM maturase HydE [Victivallaceae bacterium]|jgi:biotin synthase